METVNYELFKSICHAKGLKSTPQRYIIYSVLTSLKSHPTADALYDQVGEKLPGLGRDTVYRTLNLLAEHGLAHKVALPGGACHFDGDLSPHHHFYCESCGRIYDLPWPELDLLPWPEEASRIGRPSSRSALISGVGLCCLSPQV